MKGKCGTLDGNPRHHSPRILLIAEVHEARFFAVIADKVQDAGSIEQITFVLRYVHKEGDSKENFIAFKEQHCEMTGDA